MRAVVLLDRRPHAVAVRRRDGRPSATRPAGTHLRDGHRRTPCHDRPGTGRGVLCHVRRAGRTTLSNRRSISCSRPSRPSRWCGSTLDTIERWRAAGPRPRLLLGAGESLAWMGLAYFAAGVATTAVVWLYERKLRDVVSQSTFDLVQFSLHPLDGARITLTFGLVLLHAAVIWGAVAVTRLPSLWRTRRAFSRRERGDRWRGWPASRWVSRPFGSGTPTLSTSSLVWAAERGRQRRRLRSRTCAAARRRASQAARLFALFLALFVPSLAMYPSLLSFVTEAKEALIATQYGPQAARQREELQNVLYAALDEIEAMPWLADVVTGQIDSTTQTADRAYRAFQVWADTDLNVYRPTSAVELYGGDGRLISRFALNLPDYAAAPHQAAGCQWAVVDEMSPFGSSQRHVLRASRAICQRGEPRRLDRRQRDAGLSDASLHRVAESVSRIAAAGSSTRRRGGVRPRRGVRGVRLEPYADVQFRHQRLAADRCRVSAAGRLADAVLDDGRTRRRGLPRVLHERPRRLLCARLSGHHLGQAFRQRRRADLPRRRAVCRDAGRHHRRERGRFRGRPRAVARSCARSDRASTASCFSRSCSRPSSRC